MTSNPTQKPFGGRVIIDHNGAFYPLTEVIKLAASNRKAKVPVGDLELDEVVLRPSTSPESEQLDAVIYTRLGGKLILLAGRKLVRDALDKGVNEVPGRFLSNYALKQTKS